MPLFKGFKFSFNLSSSNDLQSELSENMVSPVYITGAYKVTEEQIYGSNSYGGTYKKLTPDMVKLPPSFQPDPTDSKDIKPSKSTSDLNSSLPVRNLPPNLRKSTPEVSSDPRGAPTNTQNTKTTDPKKNKKEQTKTDKKQLAEQKKQEKIEAQKRAKEESTRKEKEKLEAQKRAKEESTRKEKEKLEAQQRAKEESTRKEKEKLEAQQRAKEESTRKEKEKLEAQQRAKEESLRKEKEKAELKEKAKQDKLRIQKEKAEAAKARKEKKPAPKTRTNPLAQGPNAQLPYATNTLQSSISKASGPPPYEATNPNAVEATDDSDSDSDVVRNESDDTGNTSFGAPIEGSSTWDLVAQHRVQVSRAPLGGAANKVAIRLQEPLDPNVTATTGRKSLYV